MVERDSRSRIRIGVAGWDYPDWNGIVYPVSAPRSFDRLAWISRFVDLVEINSTFYRPADPRVGASWVRRTAERRSFLFTAKSHRSWTHQSGPVDGALVEPTLSGLRPLLAAGRLGALLIQFPQSFRLTPGALARIERLVGELDGWPVSVEVRHASWASDTATEWFESRKVAWCVVDQPQIGDRTLPALPRVTSPLAYLRLHGRNVSDWFRPQAGRDARYDYLYSGGELEQVAGQIRQLASLAETTFVVQNNHFRGQALVNALQLRHLVESRRAEAPEELLAAYPALEANVHVRRRKLF